MYFNIKKKLAAQTCTILIPKCFLVSTSLQIRDVYMLWLEIKQNTPSTIKSNIQNFVENRLKRSMTDIEVKKLNFVLLKISKIGTNTFV